MAYQALYRQWRPQNFNEIIGQKHIVDALKHQIQTGTFGHAYIFSGTRGTGKTSTAKIISRAVNCLQNVDGNPCNTCENCKSILEDQFIDVIEMDAASNNSVDDIRELREHVKFSPSKGAYKVYIIDEVHMLSQGAFNALLKTLEDPPSYVIFILATTEIHKIPATILSRCQRFDFQRVSHEELLDRLMYICRDLGVDYETQALRQIIRKSDGAVRDTLSLLDQCLTGGEEALTLKRVNDLLGVLEETQIYDLIEALEANDINKVLLTVNDLLSSGKELRSCLSALIEGYRNLLITCFVQSPELLLDGSQESVEWLKRRSQQMSPDHISRALNILVELSKTLRYAMNQRAMFEIALLQLMKPDPMLELSDVIERVERLERHVASGAVMPASSSPWPTEGQVPSGLIDVNAAQKEETANAVPITAPVDREEAAPVDREEAAPVDREEASPVDAFVEFAEGALRLEHIQHEWETFLKTISKERRNVLPILQEAHPVEVKGSVCTVALKPENKLFSTMLSAPQNKSYLDRVISDLVRRNVQLQFTCTLPEHPEVKAPVDEIMAFFEGHHDLLEIKEDK